MLLKLPDFPFNEKRKEKDRLNKFNNVISTETEVLSIFWVYYYVNGSKKIPEKSKSDNHLHDIRLHLTIIPNKSKMGAHMWNKYFKKNI